MPLTDAATGSTLLGQLLNAFLFTLSGGYARSGPEVMAWLQIFATIELGVAAIAWGFYRQNWMANLFWKVLGFGFLVWILDSWPTLSKQLLDGFIEAGLLVGGNVLSVHDIRDPGNIVDFGFAVTALLLRNLSKLSIWNYAFEIIFGGLAGWVVVFLYILLAVNIFKALIEYYVVGSCLIFLVPFLAHEKTAPFAERVFGTFIAHALRLLIYAALLSCFLPILYNYTLPAYPTFADAMRLLAASMAVFVVAQSSAAIAQGQIQGAPVLSYSNLLMGVGSVAQTMGAIGAVGAATSIAGASVGRGALSGASAMRAAAHVGQAAYRQSHPLAHASPRGQLATTYLGGTQGMATYAMNRVTSGFRAAIQQGRTRGQNLGR